MYCSHGSVTDSAEDPQARRHTRCSGRHPWRSQASENVSVVYVGHGGPTLQTGSRSRLDCYRPRSPRRRVGGLRPASHRVHWLLPSVECRRRRALVILWSRNMLRGCVGSFAETADLALTVHEVTFSSLKNTRVVGGIQGRKNFSSRRWFSRSSRRRLGPSPQCPIIGEPLKA